MKTMNTKGFTLVELLVVVATIAVLATVSITSISGAIQGGREASAKRQIQTLTSVYQYYLALGGNAPANGSVSDAFNALRSVVNLSPTSTVGPFLPFTPSLNVTIGNGDVVPLTFNSTTGFGPVL